MAAKELSTNNHIILLEGDTRLGGRIHTIENTGFSSPIEAGAEFIHGNLHLTKQLLQEAGLELAETGGIAVSSRNGRWVERDTMPNGWNGMLRRMGELKEDTTLDAFLQENYKEEKHAKLCERARGFAQGYDVADPAKVSVFFLRDEWTEGWDDQYRVEGGYGKMIAHMAAECLKNGAEIYTGAVVKNITWARNKVTAVTADGNEFQGEKVIVTIPVSLLQQTGHNNYIGFTPAIESYISAARNIGYGGVIKIVLEFKTAFWNDEKPGVGFVFCNEFVPTWWTQAPDEAPLITGWLGGPKADALAGTSEELIIEKSFQSLSSVFGIPSNNLQSQLVAGKVFNWPANEFSLGAYSYATPLTAEALEILNTPIGDTLYFAGEALYNGAHPGTVEAALVSGKHVAESIIKH